MPPSLELLPPNQFREMPWKNGGGVTTELFVSPQGASLALGFDLRLSTAQVTQGGPFSPFPGCDRTLLLLEGPGLDLDFGEHGRHRLDTPLVPCRFKGDWETTGQLRGGPCRDFNVITRREAFAHHLRVHRGGLQLGDAPLHLIYCLQGLAGGEVSLPAKHLLVARNAVRLRLEALVDDTVLLEIEVHPRA